MDGKSQNIFFKVAVDIVGQSCPQLIHPCPYKGEVKGYNITFDPTKFGSIFPQGKYRNYWTLTDDEDPNIMTFSFDLEITSPIKTSFG
ncbi:unnamed protein product [Diamesa serratosioi]